MTRPAVVHVYKDFWPPIVGGIECAINWMVEGLRDKYEITVLVNSRDRETREREWHGVRIVEVGEWGRAFSAPLSPSFPRWLRKLRADIWHFHIPNPTGDVSYLLSRPKGRVVATYHSDVIRQKWAMRVYGPLLNAFLSKCDVVMPTSPRLVRYSPVLRRFRKKCQPVPLGMPMDKFQPTRDLASRTREFRRSYKGFPIVSFVGKLRYYKGLQYMVSAMRSLPKVHFVIGGDGPERDKLERLVAEFELGDRVHFLGEISEEEKLVLLFSSDIFVLPSHLPSEAYGLSQVEAMACGVPVVCCNLRTGVPSVNRHGETGLVVPPADDVALAEAVFSLIEDPAKRLKMGEAALRRAHGLFSQAAMCKKIDRVYQSVLTNAPR